MKKVIITKGLSGSGKSYWAETFKEKNPDVVIINKDDIRSSMGNGYSIAKESKVIEKRNRLILEALNKGKTIIVSDTNLNPAHQRNIESLVFPKYRNVYEIDIMDFTNVPIDICIERCSSRPEGKEYWEKVINNQKDKWLSPKKLYTDPNYYLNTKLPKCVIFDMDGTLALMNGREPYEYLKAGEDLPNYPMVDIAKMFCNREDITVIILSGRSDISYDVTSNWLHSYGINYDFLYMRRDGDYNKDTIIKEEIFNKEINNKYLIYAVFDDRQIMTRMWAEKGLPLFAFGNPYDIF